MGKFWSRFDLRQRRNRKFSGDDQGSLSERTVHTPYRPMWGKTAIDTVSFKNLYRKYLISSAAQGASGPGTYPVGIIARIKKYIFVSEYGYIFSCTRRGKILHRWLNHAWRNLRMNQNDIFVREYGYNSSAVDLHARDKRCVLLVYLVLGNN
jgi:hypothetical protein